MSKIKKMNYILMIFEEGRQNSSQAEFKNSAFLIIQYMIYNSFTLLRVLQFLTTNF